MIRSIEIATHHLTAGSVNSHLIDDDPLTLVDCGFDVEGARATLEAAIGAAGRRIEDVERILLTHHHVDHAGLAGWVQQRSGAPVYAHAALAPHLRDYPGLLIAEAEFMAAVMGRHGAHGALSTQALDELRDSASKAWDIGETVALADGETIEFASGPLIARHRPGHSQSDTVYELVAARTLLTGDHLLGEIATNSGIGGLPLSGTERPKGLVAYRESLRATQELAADLCLGGHGPPIDDHKTLIDERLRHIARRADKMHAILERAAGPVDAREVAIAYWDEVANRQPFLTLSQSLGHLDLLVHDGRAVELDDGDTVRFAPR